MKDKSIILFRKDLGFYISNILNAKVDYIYKVTLDQSKARKFKSIKAAELALKVLNLENYEIAVLGNKGDAYV